MRFDLVTLKLLVAIVEEGTIAAAAEREHIVASAVSKRIAELECSLKTQLLIRKSKGIEPTLPCLALVRRARSIFHCLDELDVEIKDFSSGIKGHVRLIANPSAITQFLPQELSGFLEQHPQVYLDLEERISSVITRSVSENAADIGIFCQSDDTYGLKVFPYHYDHLVVIVPEQHALAGRKTIQFTDTLDFDFVGMHKGSAINYLLLRASSTMSRSVKLRYHVTTFEAVVAMVQAGLGIGVLPSGVVSARAPCSRLHVIPLEDRWAMRRLWICVRSLDALPPAAQLLVNHLRASAEDKVAVF